MKHQVRHREAPDSIPRREVICRGFSSDIGGLAYVRPSGGHLAARRFVKRLAFNAQSQSTDVLEPQQASDRGLHCTQSPSLTQPISRLFTPPRTPSRKPSPRVTTVRSRRCLHPSNLRNPLTPGLLHMTPRYPVQIKTSLQGSLAMSNDYYPRWRLPLANTKQWHQHVFYSESGVELLIGIPTETSATRPSAQLAPGAFLAINR